MKNIEVPVPELPHGHGLSFKKGFSDGLLDQNDLKRTCHETHFATYEKGHELGEEFRQQVARRVKA